MRKEALPPVFSANPLEERDSLRTDYMSPVEIFYEGALEKIKREGFYLIYLCAPLKKTWDKSTQFHVMEALTAASQIMGAKYQGKDVSIWIPHLHAFTVFNELIFTEARKAAIEFNRRLIQENKFFDALVVYGDRISEGMRKEIETFSTLGSTIISFDDFRKNAKRLPSRGRAMYYFKKLVTLFDSNQHTFFIP